MRRADMESAHEHGSAKDAFRVHRHDVQNFLQLVRAYLQLDRPERALSTVMDLSNWLTSLSLVQAKFEFAPSIVLWTAAQCPHVRLIRADYSTDWSRSWSKSLCEVWTFANEQAAVSGVSPLSLEVAIQEADATLCLTIGIPSGTQGANEVLTQITAYIERHKRTHNAKEVVIGCALVLDPLGTGSEA